MSRLSNVICACLCLALVAPLEAQSNAQMLEKIMNQWEKRRDIASAVEYELSGQLSYGKGCFTERFKEMGLLESTSTKQVPPEDYVSPTKVRYLLHFRNNWVRKEIREHRFFAGRDVFAPCLHIDLYDGSEYKILEPREENTSDSHVPGKLQPDLYYQKKALAGLAFAPVDFPILAAHGLVPIPQHSPTPPNLLISLPKEAFEVQGKAMKGLTEHIVLRASSAKARGVVYEYWIDIAKDSAISRWRQHRSGEVALQVETEHHQVEGTWLPRAWSTTIYLLGQKGALDKQEDVRVTRLNLQPEVRREEFQFDPKPGMIVRKVEQQKTFLVSETGSFIEVGDDGNRSTGGLWWSVAIGLALLTATGAVVYVQRKKRSRS